MPSAMRAPFACGGVEAAGHACLSHAADGGSASFPSLTHVGYASSSPMRLPRPSSANEECHPLPASFALLCHIPPSSFTTGHEHHCPLLRCGGEFLVRYRENMPLILRGLTCTFPRGMKTGIVGRTDSGKSTLIQALFCIIDPAVGRIDIDGIDISIVGLHDLRSRLSIIPQDQLCSRELFEAT